MRNPLRSIAFAAALCTGTAGLVAMQAAPASAATPYCNIGYVYQNAYVPGSDTPFTPDCIMARGALSNAVAVLQEGLNYCYQEHLSVDKQFGSLTEAALKRAQSREGTTADGVYGPKTRRAIKHLIVGSSTCKYTPN